MSDNMIYASPISFTSENMQTRESDMAPAVPAPEMAAVPEMESDSTIPIPRYTSPNMEAIDTLHAGSLKISVISLPDQNPIPNATVTIYSSEDNENPMESLITNISGQTDIIELPAPPLQWSLEPSTEQPYAKYNIHVTAEGYQPVIVMGTEVLADELSLQRIYMYALSNTAEGREGTFQSRENQLGREASQGRENQLGREAFQGRENPLGREASQGRENPLEEEAFQGRENLLEEEAFQGRIVSIPAHTLFYGYPAKLPEEEIKPLAEIGEIVLNRVAIPEFIIVHDGIPSDPSAINYWVRYKDYIKNVVSSNIYSTWPEPAIYANILVIMSFSLNRVYTEWYRNQGYDFTITSTTDHDLKWIYGRNIFQNIDYMVDMVFANYLSRPGVRQPISTSFCEGQRISCRGLDRWGSKSMGEEGNSAIDIIRKYFGNDMYVNTAELISGVPSSWPGYDLSGGSAGDKVRQMQIQLARISRNYPAIPALAADGIYGTTTVEAVRIFQGIMGLPDTGIIDYATWYEISEMYTSINRSHKIEP